MKSDALSTEARLYLKEVVQEELRKMLVFFFLLVVFEDYVCRFWTYNWNFCCILYCVYCLYPKDNDKNGSDIENTVPRNKRKREEENEEVVGDESATKKSRLRSNSSEGT